MPGLIDRLQMTVGTDTVTVFTPALRAVYLSETVDDYAVTNGASDKVELEGFVEEQLRVSLRAEIARQFNLENDMTLTPKLAGAIGYSGLDGAGLFGSLSAGLSLETAEGWSIDAGLLFNIEGDGGKSAGANVGVSAALCTGRPTSNAPTSSAPTSPGPISAAPISNRQISP